MQRLMELVTDDYLNGAYEGAADLPSTIARLGPIFKERGDFSLYFAASDKPLLLPSWLVIPDEGEKWVLLSFESFWFAWVPVDLLLTLNSSRNQVDKMFDLMIGHSLMENLVRIQDYVSDDMACFLHSQVLKVKEENRVVVLRVEIILSSSRVGPETVMPYILGPASVKFLNHEPCLLCNEEFQADQCVAWMPCKHLLHDGCITRSHKRSASCPVCNFKADFFTRYYISDDDDDDDSVDSDSDDGSSDNECDDYKDEGLADKEYDEIESDDSDDDCDVERKVFVISD